MTFKFKIQVGNKFYNVTVKDAKHIADARYLLKGKCWNKFNIMLHDNDILREEETTSTVDYLKELFNFK